MEKVIYALPYEVWRDIEGYEGLYQISSMGNIRSVDRTVFYKHGKHEKILKGKPLKISSYSKYGHKQVHFCKNGVPKNKTVHRLVAKAFIPNPNNYPCINHKDESPINNSVSNLEWCDYAYNNSYGNHNIKISHAMKGKHNGPIKSIIQYSKDGLLIGKWDSTAEASKALQIKATAINNCLKHRTKTAGGFKWEYNN